MMIHFSLFFLRIELNQVSIYFSQCILLWFLCSFFDWASFFFHDENTYLLLYMTWKLHLCGDTIVYNIFLSVCIFKLIGKGIL